MIYTAKSYALIFIVLVILFPLLSIPFIQVFLSILFALLAGFIDNKITAEQFELFANAISVSIGMVIFVANVLLLIWVWRRCSSRALTFFEGLEMISSNMMSGCANITLVYIFPNLAIVYLQTIFHTVVGLKNGKKYTEQKWIKLVYKYPKYRLDL